MKSLVQKVFLSGLFYYKILKTEQEKNKILQEDLDKKKRQLEIVNQKLFSLKNEKYEFCYLNQDNRNGFQTNKFIEDVLQLNQKNVIIILTGVSGAGKTFTLFTDNKWRKSLVTVFLDMNIHRISRIITKQFRANQIIELDIDCQNMKKKMIYEKLIHFKKNLSKKQTQFNKYSSRSAISLQFICNNGKQYIFYDVPGYQLLQEKNDNMVSKFINTINERLLQQLLAFKNKKESKIEIHEQKSLFIEDIKKRIKLNPKIHVIFHARNDFESGKDIDELQKHLADRFKHISYC